MELSVQEYQYLVSEITRETGAKRDGSGKNLIVPRCPFCGKSGGKFGIYIGKATAHRRPFMAHCFSCGASTRTLEQLLAAIGRMDLMVLQTADIAAPLNLHLLEKDEDPVRIDTAARLPPRAPANAALLLRNAATLLNTGPLRFFCAVFDFDFHLFLQIRNFFVPLRTRNVRGTDYNKLN